jgi:hypothetical protein
MDVFILNDAHINRAYHSIVRHLVALGLKVTLIVNPIQATAI